MSPSDNIIAGISIQIPGHSYLFVGSVGCAYNRTKLDENGITHILCVASSVKSKYPETYCYHRIDLEDDPSENIDRHFQECFDFINTARDIGGKVLVHCYQGKSRSVALICAYLMREYRLRFQEALSLVRQVRPIAQPNIGFMAALQRCESEWNPRVAHDLDDV